MMENQPPQTPLRELLQRVFQSALTKRNLLVFGSFILGCALTGYFFSRKESRPPEHVPLITADTSPYKIRPENDEQPQIPHEDKLVYNRLAPAAGDVKVERLLPQPEKPIIIEHNQAEAPEAQSFNTESMFPVEDTDLAPAPTKKLVEAKQPKRQETFPLLTEKPKPKPKQPVAVKPVQKKVQVAATTSTFITPMRRPTKSVQPPVKKVAAKVVTPTSPSNKPQASKVAATQHVVPPQKARYRIQLAAMRTPTLARQEWHRLIAINPQLKPLQPHFSRIDLGAKKGILYRVQGGRFVSQEQAQRLCRQLKQKTPQLPCIVVAIDNPA